jgi:UDP-GlcNAc:undecaprenyl-phosphate GlcNAc-1-phosphate transferase
MNPALISAALALAISLAIGWNADAIGRRFGLLDFPDPDGGRKRHMRVTPLVGGSAVALSTLAACAGMLVAGKLSPPLAQHVGWYAVTVAGLYAIGLADDRFGLSARIRLVLAVAMLALVVVEAPDFSLMFLRFSGQDTLWLLGGWGDAFALLCLVGLLNAVNMADGKNGLVTGLGLIWTLLLAFRLPPLFAPILAAAGASLAVTWWFNMRGRLFLGDGGSYAISAIFGLLAVYAYNVDFAGTRADDVALMFAIPVFDTVRLMIARVIAGRSPFEADRDHLHHRLHRYWGWPRGLVIYLGMVLLPNLGALLWPGSGLSWLALSALLYVGVMWRSRVGGAALA